MKLWGSHRIACLRRNLALGREIRETMVGRDHTLTRLLSYTQLMLPI